jgi:FkbM family methyltransferase
MADEASRTEYLIQLSYLLSAKDCIDIAIAPEPEWYFPRELVPLASNEVFVDCGAFDGDSVLAFLAACQSRFKAVLAFEPDPIAVGRLRRRIDQLPGSIRGRIGIAQAAVGESAGTLRFDGEGTPGSHLSKDGSLTVDCVRLDDALANVAPTFIKMDIEGAEQGALAGAAETIRRSRPVLAICVYHLQEDLFRIPLLIKQLAPDYRLFMRRQGGEGDLICFAIPAERLNDPR